MACFAELRGDITANVARTNYCDSHVNPLVL